MDSQFEATHQQPVGLFKAILLAAVASFALGAVAALASSAFADTAKPNVVINMTDKAPYYHPMKITVKPGETVEWKNDGQSVHAVSTEAQNAQNPKDASLPSGAQGFDSGFIPPGGSFSYTFKVPGTYKYFCLPHEKAGMIGYVVVKK
jgi:plastocyanin